MFAEGLFDTNKTKGRNNCTFEEADVIFVSDLFRDEYIGGAELTTDALYRVSPFKTFLMKSSEVDHDKLENGTQKIWIFFNFLGMNLHLIPLIVANCHYYIVEYDYKFCQYRSIELHKKNTGEDCNCNHQQHGKLISAFFEGAEHFFWMSGEQGKRYHEKFPFLKDHAQTLLSSVFDVEDLEYIDKLNKSRSTKEIKEEYIIVGSNSWIKGVNETKNHLDELGIPYKVVSNLPYSDLLRLLSEHKGLAFMPLGGDTCPRLVIEAKLLGLDLILNENVQHKNEDWWNLDRDSIETYLLKGFDKFWNVITEFTERPVNLSGYTTTKNVISSDYPWQASIKSMLDFCDEVVVVDGGSDDGTWQALQALAKKQEKLRVYQVKRDWDHYRFAVFDGQQKAVARSLCQGDWCWQQDIDEVVHEDDYDKIKPLARQIPKSVKIVCLPVIDYWGDEGKVRLDVNPWKWRLSRNDTHITHDIPAEHRRYDENGNVFSIGSDGCDYVQVDSYQPVPHMNFYTPQVHQVRMACLQNNENQEANVKAYNNYFNAVIDQLPGVHHYSWFDLKRKIYTYKNYWSKHWASLYNKVTEDIPENNMFFDKKWLDVSEEEIVNLAKKMNNELGGWIFHTRVDFKKPTPWLEIKRTHPKAVSDWLKSR